MSNTKLMIVDDDPGMRSQLKWGLEGYDIITADCRLDAVEKFLKHLPPLVTLDLGLPPDAEGTSEGFKTLQEILEKAPDTKVVIVSGSGEEANSAKAKSYGAFEYCSKPVETQRLQQVIERAYDEYICS